MNNNLNSILTNMFYEKFYSYNDINFDLLFSEYMNYIESNQINKYELFCFILGLSTNLNKHEYNNFIKSLKKIHISNNIIFLLFPKLHIFMYMIKNKNRRFFKTKYFIILLISKIKNKVLFILNKHLNVNYVEFVVTTKCTLKCMNCSNLMQLYRKPYDVDTKCLKESITNYFKAIDHVKKVRFIGGETLCNNNLQELLQAVDYSKVNTVDIVTNGTLIINDSKLLNIIRDKRIIIEISDYGKLSRNKDNLIKILQENNINYKLRSFDNYWIDFGYPKNYQRSNKSLKKQFFLCDSFCKSVLNGCLYYCPRESHGKDLNLFCIKNDEFVNLLTDDIKKLRKELRKIYGRTKPITACNYCLYKTGLDKKIIPAIQMKK